VSERVTEIRSKGDLWRFALSHQSGPLNWTTEPGPGGTIIVTEHEEDE